MLWNQIVVIIFAAMPFMASHGTVCTAVLSSRCFVIVVVSQPLCCFTHVDNVLQLILCRLHCSLLGEFKSDSSCSRIRYISWVEFGAASAICTWDLLSCAKSSFIVAFWAKCRMELDANSQDFSRRASPTLWPSSVVFRLSKWLSISQGPPWRIFLSKGPYVLVCFQYLNTSNKMLI